MKKSKNRLLLRPYQQEALAAAQNRLFFEKHGIISDETHYVKSKNYLEILSRLDFTKIKIVGHKIPRKTI